MRIVCCVDVQQDGRGLQRGCGFGAADERSARELHTRWYTVLRERCAAFAAYAYCTWVSATDEGDGHIQSVSAGFRKDAMLSLFSSLLLMVTIVAAFALGITVSKALVSGVLHLMMVGRLKKLNAASAVPATAVVQIAK